MLELNVKAPFLFSKAILREYKEANKNDVEGDVENNEPYDISTTLHYRLKV